jgi:two-component system, OmpR family, response regulator
MLIARIEAPFRWPAESRKAALRVGPLDLDLIERTARRREKQMLTRAMLLEEAWNEKFVPQTQPCRRSYGRLRRKVDEPPEPPVIHNVRGVGFILRAPT